MVIALLLALGLCCWPVRIVRWRVKSARPLRPWRLGHRPAWFWWVLPLPPGLALALLVPPAAGLAVAVVLGTAVGLGRSAWRRRRHRVEQDEWRRGLRSLAREVRAGADPLTAIAALRTAQPGLAGLSRVEAEMRWPGGTDPGPSGEHREVDLLLTGWRLSRRHGASWAVLLDAQAADLDLRVEQDTERRSQVAGPRASGFVLAGMPAVGLLLGAGMGADPVRVLLHTSAGGLLLLVGTALTCVGLTWANRIVRS